jgi:hypothetical protein
LLASSYRARARCGQRDDDCGETDFAAAALFPTRAMKAPRSFFVVRVFALCVRCIRPARKNNKTMTWERMRFPETESSKKCGPEERGGGC